METKVVAVKIINGYSSTTYDFMTDIELRVGDTVVVDCSTGLQLAKVVTCKVHSSKATKWVVSKVDMDAHKERMEKEEKLKALKKKMEARRKQIQDVDIYKRLAEIDPAMAELLDEYNNITK